MDSLTRTPTRPLDYALVSASYASAVVAIAFAARRRPQQSLWGLLPIGIASFSLSRLLTKDKVEVWLREPFLEELPTGDRRPKGQRLRYVIGELLSCSRCMGAWSALALTGLKLSRPREASVLLLALGSSAINDFLQAGFTRLCADADAAETRK